jgi:hypothetical protein
MTKKKRRQSPNQFGQSKLFSNHGHLLMAADFANYEYEQQCLREGHYVEGPNDRDIVFENWHVLEHLFPLPLPPDWPERFDPTEQPDHEAADAAFTEEFGRAMDEYGLADVCDRLSKIKNVYEVICGSVDREVIRSKAIKAALAERPPGTPTPDLLTPGEYQAIRELVFNSTAWRDFDDDHEEGPSLWEVLFQAQAEINDAGELSPESRDHLEQVLGSGPIDFRLAA